MNCRFCGTIVPAPPSDCPKCGRPVIAADLTRTTNQAASATIVYRNNNPTGFSPKIHNVAIVVFVAIATICAVAWGRHSRVIRGQAVGDGVSTSSPVAVDPQQGAKPSAATDQPVGSLSTTPRQLVRAEAQGEAAVEPQTPESPISKGPDIKQLLAKAEAAYSRGDWVEPAHDNALAWARQARGAGSQRGGIIEDQIYGRMMESLSNSRSAGDYTAALEQVSSMIRFFPGHTSLPSVKAAIQLEQKNVVAP